jgi:hypothetical protein
MPDVLVGGGKVVEHLASHDAPLLETDSATPELKDHIRDNICESAKDFVQEVIIQGYLK